MNKLIKGLFLTSMLIGTTVWGALAVYYGDSRTGLAQALDTFLQSSPS
ncbi:MAG: hypothetical protein M0Q44_18645 [Methylobacter sp.]|nr:hypothetical protein [Methylobacter sp.]